MIILCLHDTSNSYRSLEVIAAGAAGDYEKPADDNATVVVAIGISLPTNDPASSVYNKTSTVVLRDPTRRHRRPHPFTRGMINFVQARGFHPPKCH